MKTRKHRQILRISMLGLTAVTLMSFSVMFFSTHASESVSQSDLTESGSDIAGKNNTHVIMTESVEPLSTTARAANITFTSHGPNLGFYVNKGSSTTVYVDWGTGSFKKETSSNGYFYNSALQNSTSNIRISADIAIKSFDTDNNDNSYLQDIVIVNCPDLEELDVSGNRDHYTLDLTACTKLKKLNCSRNYYQQLKLPHSVNLTEFDCSNNLLKPSTIDVPYGQKGNYVPQYFSSDNFDIEVSETAPYDTVYSELASEYSITLTDSGGTTHNVKTTYTWYNYDHSDASSALTSLGRGKFQFSHDNIGRSYYCVMKNSHFKDSSGNTVEWKTSSVMAVPPTYTFALTLDDSFPTGGFNVGINIGAQNVFVDYGNGHGYYKRPSGDSVFAISASNVRYIKYYAESLTTITLPENCAKALDLSGAGELKVLNAGNNSSLSALDLSPCTKLVTVDVSNDGLTSLNMSGLTKLTTLNASGNKLKFSGVRKPSALKTGNFSNQHDNSITIPASVAVGQPIDLSAEYVNGHSVYTWSGDASATMNAGVAAFSIGDIGKTTSCVITHPDYPGLEVPTTQTKIIPASPVFTLTTSDNSGTFGFSLNADAQKVFVDFGAGFVEKSGGSISGTLSANTVKVYAENVTSLSAPSRNLTGINIANLSGLKLLDVSGNPSLGLPDLSHNTALTSLNISHNDIESMDIAALTQLESLDASGNKLRFSTVTQPAGFTAGNYSNQDNGTIEIPASVAVGQQIDLSAEYVDENTVFTWTPDDVTFQNSNGKVSFGSDAKGKNISGVITHPDYEGLEISVTGIRILPGFTLDAGDTEVTAEPEDGITLEDADGNPIDINEVTLKIRHLSEDELASEKAAIIAKGNTVAEKDILDGYDISLIDKNGRPVKITSQAGIKITLPYKGIHRDENTFVLYHNDSQNGIEKITCNAAAKGLIFVGHRFSAYTFCASPKSSGNGSTPSDNGNNGSYKNSIPGTGESLAIIIAAYLMMTASLAAMFTAPYLKRIFQKIKVKAEKE